MPNTKTKKFDWQIFLAVSCILLVICCATICCVIGNTEKGVASAYESESVVANTNENLSIFATENNRCYNVLYFNPYADFNIAFSAMYIYSDLRYSGEDYAVNFFTLYTAGNEYGKSFFINYPDENKYVFLLTTDDGYSNIENNRFRDSYPTTSSLVESYANDFARILIVCDFDTENYVFSVSTLLYADIYNAYDDAAFEVIRNYDIADETGLYFMDTMFSYNTNFFITNMSFHDLPRFKFIDTEDFVYFNYRISNYSFKSLERHFVNQQDFESSPYFDDDIYDGEVGLFFATFSNGVDIYKFYYSWSWGGFVFVKNESEILDLPAYSITNFGFRNNKVSSYKYIYDNSEERLYKFNVVSTTPIFDEYYYEFHTMFSGTYNFLTYDTALMYKAIGTESDTAYENGYQTGVNEGYNQGFSAGHTAGYDTGYDAGYDDGHTAGYDDAVSELQPQIDELNAELQEVTRERDEYYVFYQQLSWAPFVDSNYNNLKTAYFDGMKTTVKAVYDIGGGNVGVMLIDDSGTANGLIGFLGFGQIIQSGRVMKISWKDLRIQYQTGSSGDGGFLPVHIAVMSGDSLIDVYVTNEETMIDGSLEFTLPVDADGLYFYNSEATTYLFISGLVGYMNEYDGEVIYQNGYDAGYSTGHDVGYSDGHQSGEQSGYNKGYSDALEIYADTDISFFALLTSVVDAPIQMIVGKWNSETQQMEGGMLNFYIPGLDINLAPFLLSMFTICIVVMVVRFILARKE